MICHLKEHDCLSSSSEYTGMSYDGKLTLMKSVEALTIPQSSDSQMGTLFTPWRYLKIFGELFFFLSIYLFIDFFKEHYVY